MRFLVLSAVILATKGDRVEKKEPYKGSAIKISVGSVVYCRTDDAVSAGFWFFGGAGEKGWGAGKEPGISTWRIRFLGETAMVSRTSPNDLPEDLIEKRFSVERTLDGGVLLMSARTIQGESPQVITIDPDNGSFVYTTQHTNSQRNRANVFYGSCSSK